MRSVLVQLVQDMNFMSAPLNAGDGNDEQGSEKENRVNGDSERHDNRDRDRSFARVRMVDRID